MLFLTDIFNRNQWGNCYWGKRIILIVWKNGYIHSVLVLPYRLGQMVVTISMMPIRIKFRFCWFILSWHMLSRYITFTIHDMIPSYLFFNLHVATNCPTTTSIFEGKLPLLSGNVIIVGNWSATVILLNSTNLPYSKHCMSRDAVNKDVIIVWSRQMFRMNPFKITINHN